MYNSRSILGTFFTQLLYVIFIPYPYGQCCVALLLYCWLVEIYDIPTLVDYLIINPFC